MEEVAETGDNNVRPVKGKGGQRATSFIYALLALENMGFVANMASLFLYFLYKLYFNVPTASTTLTNLYGTTFLLTVVGGFISDTYVDRFHTTLFFGLIEVLAMSMMTIQAKEPKLLPQPCGLGKSHCIEGGKAAYLYATLGLLALGCGGVKGALPAFGADQYDATDEKQAKGLAGYFNWLLLSTIFGAAIGVTLIVGVSTSHHYQNWWRGFLISTVAAFVGYVVFAVGKPYYRTHVPKDSPLLRVAQVIAVAIKNIRLPHPESPSELYETNDKDSEQKAGKIAHTEQFRWLDKAAILPPDTEPSDCWKVCTVTQVEEVKVLTRMMPIIFSTIVMNTCLAQLQTLSMAQGAMMSNVIGNVKFPTASIPVIPLSFMIILIPIYARVLVPFIRRYTHHPAGITQLQRVGVGLVLSILSMSIAALVEVKRKNASLKNPLKPISLFWLSFQFGVFGIADMFTLVGLLEFFYKEAPVGMRSLSTSFTFVSLSFGYFLSSVLVNTINAITKRVRSNGQPWLLGMDLDASELNLFYWFLAVLSVLNFFHYLFWATWYKYKNHGDDCCSDGIASAKAKEDDAIPLSVSGVQFLKADAAVEDASNTQEDPSGNGKQ